ncbi:hypothetical protein Skr01_57310 [Sphaerisporangium krabiense]|uniref:DeoxyPurine in DNA protein A domain-containing protein n=1 Tax=Sphaerisporangium krabiense TaxID=763782 RepID=A0A7W8Z9F5_9ACTN|nr:hypothetical protein [Sphaerisporangium krabiense]MBB5629503.1 hypothetical protein [Sphaerisporangium krabiense]GII65646.1 hypothetical protein Skr01_57310 [Sphaerisporangium krabiense]
MKFYLGTHHPGWLRLCPFPLFVSHRRLSSYKTLPRAIGEVAIDSGGFTELSLHGTWTASPRTYGNAIRRYVDEIGNVAWAAPQDWMCEPFMLTKTGLTLREHQHRTVGNYLDLRSAFPDLPIVPVVQGWSLNDYLHCVTLYDRAGIDLTAQPLVGLGSVCRRQHSTQIHTIVTTLAAGGLRLHGFGVKTRGLQCYAASLASADSLAWSYQGRRTPSAHPGHINEANCRTFAETWRARLLATLRWQQPTLDGL